MVEDGWMDNLCYISFYVKCTKKKENTLQNINVSSGSGICPMLFLGISANVMMLVIPYHGLKSLNIKPPIRGGDRLQKLKTSIVVVESVGRQPFYFKNILTPLQLRDLLKHKT